MKVLVTGGCGYIGSHTAKELIENKHEVVIIDNLCNSYANTIDKIEKITGIKPRFYKGDVCNKELVKKILLDEKIDAVIHFAGLKAVGESVKKPLMYYRNNIDSTLSLCEAMDECNCRKLIFSSSATVYGEPNSLPIDENVEIGKTTNPYGNTKFFIEKTLNDLYNSNNNWSIIILRYFNPVGSDESYLLGEDPKGIPNNLMPYIVKVAIGELEYLNIFGDDYKTKDGTGIRDYIHVVDLAYGHVCALKKTNGHGIHTYNLGTGQGYSVLELVTAFEKINKIKINKKIVARREGDIAECYANCSKAKKELGWESKLGLNDMVKSAYMYAIKNKE